MRTVVVKIDKTEKEQEGYARKRANTLGVHNMPTKATGSVGKYRPRTGLTKGVKSAKIKYAKANTKLESWKRYLDKDITFGRMMELQATGK